MILQELGKLRVLELGKLRVLELGELRLLRAQGLAMQNKDRY